MAETATPARTTRPRTRSAKAPVKAAAKPVEAEETTPAAEEAETDVERYKVALTHVGETARYAKWELQGAGCVGNIYTPKGATRVVILVEGPKG